MKTIQLTDEQYQALLQGESVTIKPPKKQWEPKPGAFYIEEDGSITKFATSIRNAFGMAYPTQEAAEKARDAMRVHNRLLAWLAENDDGWVADWSDGNQPKYYVYFSHNPKVYKSGYDWWCEDLSKFYMSYQNAEKLYNLLNSGEVVL